MKRKALLFAAMEYPENLGTGRPPSPVFAREHYLIGLCYENMGDKKRAEEYYKKAEREQARIPSEHAHYKALALKKLGKLKKAEEILKKLKEKH